MRRTKKNNEFATVTGKDDTTAKNWIGRRVQVEHGETSTNGLETTLRPAVNKDCKSDTRLVRHGSLVKLATALLRVHYRTFLNSDLQVTDESTPFTILRR